MFMLDILAVLLYYVCCFLLHGMLTLDVIRSGYCVEGFASSDVIAAVTGDSAACVTQCTVKTSLHSPTCPQRTDARNATQRLASVSHFYAGQKTTGAPHDALRLLFFTHATHGGEKT